MADTVAQNDSSLTDYLTAPWDTFRGLFLEWGPTKSQLGSGPGQTPLSIRNFFGGIFNPLSTSSTPVVQIVEPLTGSQTHDLATLAARDVRNAGGSEADAQRTVNEMMGDYNAVNKNDPLLSNNTLAWFGLDQGNPGDPNAGAFPWGGVLVLVVAAAAIYLLMRGLK